MSARHGSIIGPATGPGSTGDCALVRPGDGHLIDARLQGVGFRVPQRRRATNIEHGGAVQIGVGHRRDDVSEAGTGGDECHPKGAVGACVTFGGMPGGHFVAGVEHVDRVIAAGLEQGLEMGAMQAENLANPGLG